MSGQRHGVTKRMQEQEAERHQVCREEGPLREGVSFRLAGAQAMPHLTLRDEK